MGRRTGERERFRPKAKSKAFGQEHLNELLLDLLVSCVLTSRLLRHKPDPRHPQYILTVHGMGYKFAG